MRLYKDPDTGMRYPSVTTVLGELAKPGIAFWNAKIAGEAGDPAEPRRLMEEKATFGTRVHNSVLTGVWPKDLRAVQRRYAEAWNANPFDIIAQEQTIWNREHEYAGTYDILASMDDETWLVDVKTSESGIHEESVRLQLAGYAFGEDMPQIDRYFVLWLRPDAWEFREVEVGPAEFEIFLHLREVYRWRRNSR